MEKIFKREDGSQVKLTFYFTNGNNEWEPRGMITPRYTFYIETREKGKKKWRDPMLSIRDTWEYREQPFPHGRLDYERKEMMKYVSEQEMYEAYLELWESIKPKL
jgi:hypothetical protein